MDCIECGEDSKYKCPVCRQPYCSVACCKVHKEKQCTPPSPPKNDAIEESQIEYEFPTDHTVPIEKLKSLENSKELQECISNPHVREILQLLDKSPHPDKLMQEYMQEPIFTEFVDACLKVVQDEPDDE
ncbi:zinc finger HIT domain-containing protein 3 isoform X2 [Aricia agestis]|uniref:zinc finger HIT domain-containing protein 3 isoform X1 n=1 Tax=Aricia agestis TaxID=91739 RepID=UPI001C205AEC|nr:zinc finger HIT domain-containing protein 3 isoform X1 [Aricia agestis]XP_041979212.1 zinc finger HIT domain-containing protein 3 isoform X2 [Aricia agestis]